MNHAGWQYHFDLSDREGNFKFGAMTQFGLCELMDLHGLSNSAYLYEVTEWDHDNKDGAGMPAVAMIVNADEFYDAFSGNSKRIYNKFD
jgi:hypothetical protein